MADPGSLSSLLKYRFNKRSSAKVDHSSENGHGEDGVKTNGKNTKFNSDMFFLTNCQRTRAC